MENRRTTENPSDDKPYNRNKKFSNSNTGGKSFGAKTYQPRDNRNFQNKDDRSQNRNNGGENRFQDRNDRDNRFPPRTNNGDNRNERYQSRDNNGGYKPRENQSRDNQNRDNRFQSRDNRDNRFQSRDSRDNRDNRYGKPTGKFPPRSNNFQGKKPFFPKGKTTKPWEDERNKPRIVSDMQITDGKHRGKYMVSSVSPKMNLTSRRLREVMFRILYRKIRAKRFLDLCAGSGTVGIEAMSRGALLGTFVERSARMVSFIKKNMATCEIKEGHGEVFGMEVVPFLKEMKKRKRCWDVVYFDPPYDADYDEVLKYLSRGTALNLGGTLVIEHHAEMFFPEKIGQLKRWRVVVQGDSALSFFERK